MEARARARSLERRFRHPREVRVSMRLRKPSPAMAVACISLFIGLSGVGTAAVVVLKKNSVLSKHIKNGQVQSADVKDSSLLTRDFAPGQLPRGEKGETGERGPQGPGAVKIAYSDAGGLAPITDVAAVSPWTIGASCHLEDGVLDLLVWVRGPGEAHWAGMTSVNADAPTPLTRGVALDPDFYVVGPYVFLTPSGEYQRMAFDIQLHSNAATATVSVNGLADHRGGNPGTCTLVGTAVAAT